MVLLALSIPIVFILTEQFLLGIGSIILLIVIALIIQLKLTKDALKQAKQEAKLAKQVKSEFLANMNHEIKTPLNAIISFSYLIQQTNLNDKQHNYLIKVEQAANTLSEIINNILDFSKIDAAQLKIESFEFNLNEVLSEVANITNINIGNKNIEIIFFVSPKIPLNLVGDSLRLRQILINLTDNAIKFTERGKVLITTELVEKKTETEKITLRFSVRDTGIGMTADYISKIFQMFTQENTSSNRKYGGTGLGLAISKRLVEMMGGELCVESEPNQGSIFTFTADFGIAIQDTSFKLFQKQRALIVNDSQTTILKKQLKKLAFNVTTVESGQAALKELETAINHPYHLVLIDCSRAQEIDAIKVIPNIKNNTSLPLIPKIILVTTFDIEKIKEKAKEAKIDAFLMKPFTSSSLLNSIVEANKVDKNFQTKPNKIITPPNFSGYRILVVEDNMINRQVAKEILESTTIIVDIAESGNRAIEKLNLGIKFDVILMDIQMPDMDGYETTKIIRKSFKTLPIIAMTASLTTEREKCIAFGMNDYVSKPINVTQFFKTLSDWLPPKPEEFIIKPEKEKFTEEMLTHLPGIDSLQVLQLFNKNLTLFNKLLVKFKEDNLTFIDELKILLDKGDIKKAQYLCHTLKGISGNLGAMDVFKATNSLEKTLKEGKYDFIQIKKLEETLLLVFKAATLCKIKKYPNATKLKYHNISSNLKKLNQSLATNNLNAGKLFEVVYPQISNPAIAPELEKLGICIMQLDFKEARRILHSIAKVLSNEK
jgi:signal transduction histidine kinase/CheY-like chemotaxis protein